MVADVRLPDGSGFDLAYKFKADPKIADIPLLLISASFTSPNERARGLDAGADGYMTKPVNAHELQARVRAGMRTIALQHDLRMRLHEAQAESARTKPLRELLPMCCCCRRIRDDRQHWSTLEQYLAQKVDVQFTHGFCPACLAQHVPPEDRV